MITELCDYLHNYFCDDADKHFGKFEIKNGSIAPPDFLQDGQFYRIVGSAMNDGVYQYPSADLTDETFEGAVWAMKVPPAFVALAEEIKKYRDSDAGKESPYVSESFGGYTYTKATDASGGPVSWTSVFRSRLNRWRKMR